MKALKKYVIMLSLCVILICMLQVDNAFSSSKTNSVTSANNPIPPADVLRASALAMLQIKTFHIAIVYTNVQSESLTAGGVNTVTTKLNYDGDEQLPDQISAKVSLAAQSSSQGTTPINGQLAEIVQGMKIYLQPSTSGQQWTVYGPPLSIDPSSRAQLLILPVDDYLKILSMLVPFAQDSDIVDHGTENIQGANLHHFTVTLGNNAFGSLIDLDMADNTYSSEAQTLNSATLDVWLDDATSYVYNVKLNVQTSEDDRKIFAASPVPSATPIPTTTTTLAVSLSIAFSRFNQAVSIVAPANAVPATSLPDGLLP